MFLFSERRDGERGRKRREGAPAIIYMYGLSQGEKERVRTSTRAHACVWHTLLLLLLYMYHIYIYNTAEKKRAGMPLLYHTSKVVLCAVAVLLGLL